MVRIVGTALYQWDTGRYVTTDIEADHIHFSNKGDSKAVIMDLVDSQAKIPDYLLQTGKQLCVYVVRNGITVEKNIFFVNYRERPENYIYEEDQRNFVYELIASAEAATEAANQAAAVAAQAGQDADGSANRAKMAAEAAETASNDANKAAVYAAQTAKSLMVVGEARGTAIYLDNAINQFLVGCRIFGKTTQDGIPTPDAPVNLVSVGEGGSITVNVTGANEAQSMTIATPNGLPGIPVASGGNYTDANGQQWICDEIDFARGIYVRRIVRKSRGEIQWNFNAQSKEGAAFTATVNDSVYLDSNYDKTQRCLCNIFVGVSGSQRTELNTISIISNKRLYINLPYSTFGGSVDASNADNSSFFNTWWASNDNATVLYQLATPIETPLSEEELAAYAKLHTYRGNTTVSNDAGAWMDIEYVMDAKKYIDSLVTGGIAPARVE